MESTIKYKSKVDNWVYVVTFVMLAVPFHLVAIGERLEALLFILIDMFFIVHPLLTTSYTFTDTGLRIKCGFFYNFEIPYQDITSFRETDSIFSAPAFSLDRLEIQYKSKGIGMTVISPERKIEFLNRLHERTKEVAVWKQPMRVK